MSVEVLPAPTDLDPNPDPTSWHSGNIRMQSLMSAPHQQNPTQASLTYSAALLLRSSPLLAVGAVDRRGRPWTTLWGGERGFARAVARDTVAARALVDARNDPVLKILAEESPAGEGEEEERSSRTGEGKAGGGTNTADDSTGPDLFGKGHRVSGLAIDLEARRRVKFAGTVVGALADAANADASAGATPGEGEDPGAAEPGRLVAEAQMVVQVDSSLGNCPKYLNKKTVRASVPSPRLLLPQDLSRTQQARPTATASAATPSLPLSPEALSLIAAADLFFITASASGSHMSTNHRGGPPGFIRVLSNDIGGGVRLAYPEYSGNRLYQTLGNLQVTPRAGLVIPDFRTGDALYATATTSVLVGSDAARLIPRSNLVIVLTLIDAPFVRASLGVRASDGEPSPYNPPVRLLSSEQRSGNATAAAAAAVPAGAEHKRLRQGPGSSKTIATLVDRTFLSDKVARLVFETDEPVPAWKAGQHVALDFSAELDMGYSHMRDDDPTSLNDDFVRTFTISSAPPSAPHPSSSSSSSSSSHGRGNDGTAQQESETPSATGTTRKFEITVRKSGPVTQHLLQTNVRARVSAAIVGFGGEFSIGTVHPSRSGPGGDEHGGAQAMCFVAGGVGITPLLAQMDVFLGASALDPKRQGSSKLMMMMTTTATNATVPPLPPPLLLAPPPRALTLLWAIRASDDDLSLARAVLARWSSLAAAAPASPSSSSSSPPSVDTVDATTTAAAAAPTTTTTTPKLPAWLRVRIFVSGEVSSEKDRGILQELGQFGNGDERVASSDGESGGGGGGGRGVEVFERRMQVSDVVEDDAAPATTTWYVCAGARLQRDVEAWLEGRDVVTERFDY